MTETLQEGAPAPGGGLGLAGRVVGAYTLVRPLGEGGMGTVWLARRSDGRFEGEAAVKLPQAALLGSAGVERFRREGVLLGRLSHPNIARLLDAGIAEGQPYLVLERVEGEPIDAWCDTRALGVAARIRLFERVVAAVAHAHDRLVLHRDLKPSNILVTADGTPKLLDFGVAKLLEEDGATEVTALTAHAQWFTPGYAAPEQVEGAEVSAGTDVYALGVVLYELLAGAHPTGAARARKPLEQLRAVVDEAPPLASAAAARGPEEIARRRGTTPRELARSLRGDLDLVLGHALEKDPRRRYPSARSLGEDLRRWAAHEPIAARAPSRRYRLGKAVRRHRVAFGMGAAVAAALVAGVVGTAWQAVEAGRQRAEAVRARERADREAAAANAQRDFAFRQLSRAEAVAELNTFLVFEAAPNGRPFTAAELLARAERIIERQEPATDANRIEGLIAVGRQYSGLEDYARARALLEEAHRLAREAGDPAIQVRAACALGATLAYVGEGSRGEALVAEGLAAIPREPQAALDRVACLLRGSEVARVAGDGAVGVERARAAEAEVSALPFPAGYLAARVAIDLGEAYRVAGRLPEAVETFRRAAQLVAAAGRDDTEGAGTLYNNWAVALSQLGRPLEAEPLYRRAVRIASAGGDRNVSTQLQKNRALGLLVLGRVPEAIALAERALGRARRAGQEVVVNQTLIVLASAYRERGDLDRGERMLRELEPRLRRMLPAGHYAFATLASLWAQLHQARGDFAAARGAADRAVALAEASGQGPWLLASVLERRADLADAERRWADARRDAERAVEAARGLSGGAPSRQLGLAQLALAKALDGLGDPSAAEAFAAARATLAPAIGPGHPLTALAERRAHARTEPTAAPAPARR